MVAYSAAGLIVLNPASGLHTPDELTAFRTAIGVAELEPLELRPGLDVVREVRTRIASGCRLVIAAGGDGTLNHVVQPVVTTEATFAVVPMGTWNHFARDLGVVGDWRAGLDVALHGETTQVDTAVVNDRYFLNNISIGLYPEIVAHRERVREGVGKWRAYQYATWMAFKKFPSVSLMIEVPPLLQPVKTHLFMVSVNPYDFSQFGVMAPRTTLTGGRLSVYWVPEMGKRRFIRLVAKYWRGRIAPEDGFRSMQAPTVKIQSSKRRLELGMDGELFEFETPLVISTVPQSLLVRVPRT